MNWLCRRLSDGKLVVRKTYRSWAIQDDMPREAYILQRIIPSHRAILYCDSWSIDHHHSDGRPRLNIYYGYCEGGDVLRSFTKTARGLSENALWNIFVKIASALAFLHFGYDRRRANPDVPPRGWQMVVHRDLKPDNVFYRSPYVLDGPLPSVVLGDFGLATLNSSGSQSPGPAYWQGPEYPQWSAKTDIWGLGATIHTLAHGHGPVDPVPTSFADQGPEGRAAWSSYPRSKNPCPLPPQYSTELNWCMMSCLSLDPRDRINSRDLVRHLGRILTLDHTGMYQRPQETGDNRWYCK